MILNQNPEQRARDWIDAQLATAGWVVQAKNKSDFSAGIGVAVREYGPADYVLFIEGHPAGAEQNPDDKPASLLLERIRAEQTGQPKIRGCKRRTET